MKVDLAAKASPRVAKKIFQPARQVNSLTCFFVQSTSMGADSAEPKSCLLLSVEGQEKNNIKERENGFGSC